MKRAIAGMVFVASVVSLPALGEPGIDGLTVDEVRDLARFGLLFTPTGRSEEDPVVSDAYLSAIQNGGRPELTSEERQRWRNEDLGDEAFLHSTRHWDIVTTDGDLYKGGFAGQGLNVSPSKDLVVAWFGTGDGGRHGEMTKVARRLATSGLFDPEEPTSASGLKIETGFAKVNGSRLYYEVAGTGDPIVLIHGNFGDRRYFDSQFEALARLHRVLRYDIRGYGKSMLPEEGVPYSDFEDLEAMMAHLDIDRAHIAGFSLGSAIAVDFCLAFPDRCSSLIAIGPWFFGYDSPLARTMFQDFGAISAAAASGGRNAALEQLLAATWWYPEKVQPRAFDRVKAIWTDYDFWHFKNPDPRQVRTPLAAEQLDRITAPTMIITAEYDLDACRAVAQQMDAEIPDSTMVDLAGATHFMFIEEPEKVNAALLAFLVEAAGR